jgi:hypothetical protein
MTKLPDGSGCFTATVMSEEEAMALPLKERPLCFRLSSKMYHDTFEAIGEASMCWNPQPSDSVFASEQASDVAVRLCFKIAEETEALRSERDKALALVASYDRQDEVIGAEFEGVDGVTDVIRLLKTERDQLRAELVRLGGGGGVLEGDTLTTAEKETNEKAQRLPTGDGRGAQPEESK